MTLEQFRCMLLVGFIRYLRQIDFIRNGYTIQKCELFDYYGPLGFILMVICTTLLEEALLFITAVLETLIQ